jgi:hypothetical protein
MISRSVSSGPAGLSRSAATTLISGILIAVAGCAALTERGRPLVPTRHQVAAGPFLIFSNFPISEEPLAVNCLRDLERDLARQLDFHAGSEEDPVEIYVLDDRNAFVHFLKFYFPELPQRRAFFLAQGQQRVVYTYLSPRLEEDLRHEATHALLHGTYGDIPLWLDEGLAEYFESDLTRPGVEAERLQAFRKDVTEGANPSLERLAALSDIRQMTPRDYREAWAWVHLLLKGPASGKSALLGCLSVRDPAARNEDYWRKLVAGGATSERLLSQMAPHSTADGAVERVSGSPSGGVRLQNQASEPAGPPNLVRGLWKRLSGWIGF